MSERERELEPCWWCGSDDIVSVENGVLICATCGFCCDINGFTENEWNLVSRALREYRDPDTVAVPRDLLEALADFSNAAGMALGGRPHEAESRHRAAAAARALLDQETDG